jgi:putative ATP-binding cassette transporter
VALFLMMAVSSQMDVYQSYKFKDYLTALSEKDLDVFSENIVFLIATLFLSLPLTIVTKRLEAIILLRWRGWTTEYFTKLYLSNKTYYKMIVANNNKAGTSGKVDNPDQRISADIETFTRLTFQYTSELVETSMRFVAFAPVLWEISPYLFIFLIVYSCMPFPPFPLHHLVFTLPPSTSNSEQLWEHTLQHSFLGERWLN